MGSNPISHPFDKLSRSILEIGSGWTKGKIYVWKKKCIVTYVRKKQKISCYVIYVRIITVGIVVIYFLYITNLKDPDAMIAQINEEGNLWTNKK